ncbi:MAG: MATE family efflux transporter [Oscillospiraceae bacterium]|nr:MATE family efflux transporter [Oscillospiraceae bacterium]
MARAMSEEKKQRMLHEDIRTLIPAMAVPTIVAQLITTIYNLVDTYFVSTLGTNATAAVGVNASLERAITLIGSLIGAGACSYISRLLGAKREEDAHRVLSTSFFTGIGLGVVLLVLGKMLIEPMVYFLGATPECAEYSMQYANYVLYAAPFMVGSFILNMCLRSEGSATFSMIGIGFGGILNCFLDPLFIYKFQLGVAGASMATAISKFISFCILLWPYIRKKSSVQIAIQKFRYVAEDVKSVLSIGSTSFFRSAGAVVCSTLINRIGGSYSTSALAALSISNRVMEFPFAIILGFGQGYQPVVGFNWGAKSWDRVKKSLDFALKVSVIGGLVIGLLLIIFANPVVHIFNKQADSEVLSIGVYCIRFQSALLFAHAINSIINMFYAGIGKAKWALLMSTARQGYLFIPLVFILPPLFGTYGVASVQATADLVSLAISIPLMLKAYKMIREAAESD